MSYKETQTYPPNRIGNDMSRTTQKKTTNSISKFEKIAISLIISTYAVRWIYSRVRVPLEDTCCTSRLLSYIG